MATELAIKNRVRELRIKKLLRISDLSKISGVSFSALIKIELGITKNPSLLIQQKIANALGEDKSNIFLS